jgi:pyrrolidone-carboxylate peptidase
VFYCARHEIDTLDLDIPCGFIHIPMMKDADHPQAETGLPLDVLIDAILTCLDVVHG